LIDSPKENIHSRKAKQSVYFKIFPKENPQNKSTISPRKTHRIILQFLQLNRAALIDSPKKNIYFKKSKTISLFHISYKRKSTE
jgi:hypothetical protein